jgi:hypothetical protein
MSMGSIHARKHFRSNCTFDLVLEDLRDEFF